MQQIHTDKSLFLHKAPSVKPTPPSPLLFQQEDATGTYRFSNYNGNIFLQKCVPFFHFSVSWFSELQFGVIYIKAWGSTQPYVISLHLYFVLVPLFLAEYTWNQILLHCISQCLLYLESSLFSWLVDGVSLLCLAPFQFHVSLNCQCDKFNNKRQE